VLNEKALAVTERVVKKLTGEGLAQVDLTATCAGTKVLGQARAFVRP